MSSGDWAWDFAEMMGFGCASPSPDPVPGTGTLDFDPSPTTDVVPIAGDSGGDVIDTDLGPMSIDPLGAEVRAIVDRVDPPNGPFAFAFAQDHPLALTVVTAAAALVIGLPIALTGGGPSKPTSGPGVDTVITTPTTAPATTTVPATTTAPATTATTTAAAPPTPTAADADIANFSLISPQGFEFSLESPSDAPRRETITLAFTGAGLPSRVKVTLAAGHSRELKYPTQGCGKWTVRVAAIDSKPIRSKGNPDLQNGMTHAC